MIAFAGVPPETWRLVPDHAARFEAFGQGCAGQNGTPTLAARTGSLPWLGEAFELELRNLPPGPFCLLLLGASRVQWGPVPLPARLDHLGMTGCVLFVSGEVVLPLAAAGGLARTTLGIPTDPAIVGAQVFTQAWHMDWLANPGLAIVGNAGVATIGNRWRAGSQRQDPSRRTSADHQEVTRPSRMARRASSAAEWQSSFRWRFSALRPGRQMTAVPPSLAGQGHRAIRRWSQRRSIGGGKARAISRPLAP